MSDVAPASAPADDDGRLGARAARGSAVTLVSQGIRVGVLLVSTVVLARLLSPEDFGLYAMVAALIGISETLRDLGLSSAAVRRPDLTRAQGSNLFWINVGTGAACWIVVSLAAVPISGLFGEDRLVSMIRLVAPVFLLNGIATQFKAEINRSLRFTALAVCELVPQLVALGVAIVLAFADRGAWALIGQQIVTAVLALALAVSLARWRPGLPTRRVGTRSLLSFGLGVAGTQLIGTVTRNIDNILIGWAWGPTSLGLYNRGYQLLMAPLNQIAVPMTRVALPILARVHARDDGTFPDVLRRAQLVGAYLTASLYCVAAGVAAPLVDVALGGQWSEVVPIFQVLAFGGVFRAILQVSYWAYLASGRSHTQLRVYATFQPVIILSMIVGLRWGAIGVAWGHSIGYALYWAISLVMLERNLGIPARPLIASPARAVACVGVPAGAAAWLASEAVAQPVGSLAAGLVAAALTVGVAALAIRPVGDELRMLFRFARTAIKR